jgi:hypothetical protein
MSDPTLYDRDFYAWANEQAALLRAGNLSAADIAHIAEEIESMGKTEKRELVSRLTVLLVHLLKWQYQPNLSGNSWRLSIANSRDQLADHLADNPSLKARLPEALASAYRYARRDAARETGMDVAVFPAECPWSFEQIMDADFWPASHAHPRQ